MMTFRSSSKRSDRSSKRSGKVAPIVMPLQPIKCCHRIAPKERMFLDAAERGDRHTIFRCLQPPDPVNVNCTNMLGRSAIQIAVDNENVEICELLLQQNGVKVGDALLYAIQEGVFKIVEMLIDHPSISPEMLGKGWPRATYVGEESNDYSPDISPVILAAHCNQFEILQLLLMRGAVIDSPHQLSCTCRRCREKINEDSLRHSLRRINIYRALASPAWISLTSSDPILQAFNLSWELKNLALREPEFKDAYIELSSQCKKIAYDLLDQCRTTDEVIAVLNRSHDSSDDDDDEYTDKESLSLPRLKLAIKYEQKEFVAHPNCQQLLASVWYEGLPGWRKRTTVAKIFLSVALILMMPAMAFYYWLFPRSRAGQMLRSPFVKFVYHSASFGAFLGLLIVTSMDVSSIEDRAKVRGPAPTETEWLLFIWVIGFIWAECKQLWEEGLKAYVRQWWNWLDFIMLSLYLTTFSLRFVAYFQMTSGLFGPQKLDRELWPLYDPTMVSEGLFAIANVFSFARIIFLCQADQYLGPLQISLGCMLIDIAKFLFIFFLVITSFACGLNQLYWYYTPRTDTTITSFHSLESSYRTLYWSLFSMSHVKEIRVAGGQMFTEFVGEMLFMAYQTMAVIVLINMLIAMMSNSFQIVENHADMEWKFTRSKLWMGYFDEGSTLPPPFNIIVSPKSIVCLVTSVRETLNKCCGWRSPKEKINKYRISNGISMVSGGNLEVPNQHSGPPQPSAHAKYEDTMRRLVTRFIHQSKKQKRQNGVNEDDLLEIKQDISSLRCEIREDRLQSSSRSDKRTANVTNSAAHVPNSDSSNYLTIPELGGGGVLGASNRRQPHLPLDKSFSFQPIIHREMQTRNSTLDRTSGNADSAFSRTDIDLNRKALSEFENDRSAVGRSKYLKKQSNLERDLSLSSTISSSFHNLNSSPGTNRGGPTLSDIPARVPRQWSADTQESRDSYGADDNCLLAFFENRNARERHSSGHLISQNNIKYSQNIEALRLELIRRVRDDLSDLMREALHERVQRTESINHVPALSSDLYQTHLYTQL